MGPKTKILILEHDAVDIDLLLHELDKSGINYEPKIVQTEPEFTNAIKEFVPDIILADYSLPSFDGPAAFNIKEKINPGIPFIFVSGTIGEEKAVELIKNGVTDYALKDKLFVLNPKITRALGEAEEKKEKTITDEKLLKANNLNAFISQVNQKIVRVKDETTLFHNSCEIAIKFGKFKMAWIGLFDLENQKISLVEQCGIVKEDLGLFTNAPYRDKGPQHHVLLTRKYFVCNNIQDDLELENWKPYAMARGIQSCIVLPVKKSGNIIGTFNLYSEKLNFLDKEEIKLLVEVTDDISFALDLFEKETKQKATEELVVKNEKRFRALIEKSADMKTLSNQAGDFIYSSPSVTKVLGYSPEEFLKINSFKLIHQDDLAGFLEKRKSLLETPGLPINVQIRFKHKNGNWIWCEGSITNLLHEPNIQALVSNFNDISERKKMESEREFDENNLNALINNTSDLMWSVDKDFNLITSNKPFEEMGKLNFGRAILKGESVLSVSHTPEMLNHFKQIYERAFAGEFFTETAYFDIPFEFWTEISYSPIRKGDLVIGAACHSRDITERKRSEENLKQSEAGLKEAQAISHTGNWEFDFARNTHTWSNELYNILGLRNEEAKPSTELFLSFIHPEDIDEIKIKVDEAFRSLKATSYHFRFIKKNGAIRYGYTERKFEFDKNGKPTRLLGVVQDITERKLVEEEREKMLSNIVQHSKNLEQFTSIVSHNLRAPVANILGLSNVLKNNITEDDRARSQQFLFRATEQLDDVLKDMVKILQARSEINEYKETVYFEELVNSVKSSIHNIIEREMAQIVTDFGAMDKITSIKSYLHSIFYNLISNSIKYRQPGKEPLIKIKSEILGDNIVISFRDNGSGIDLVKHSDKIFGLYQRFNDNIEGKGLGLFMVKTQIETLGGNIKIKSEPGEGTEFTLEFPYKINKLI